MLKNRLVYIPTGSNLYVIHTNFTFFNEAFTWTPTIRHVIRLAIF